MYKHKGSFKIKILNLNIQFMQIFKDRILILRKM